MTIFQNGIVDSLPAQRELVYKRVRTDIMDGKIPLYKAVGFKVVSKEVVALTVITDRHLALKDSMLQLMSNMSKLIFLPHKEGDKQVFPEGIVSTADRGSGIFTTSNMTFHSMGKEFSVLNQDTYLYEVFRECNIRLVVVPCTGHNTVLDSVTVMKRVFTNKDIVSTYLPIHSDFNLNDYVRIRPWLGEGEIRYTLHNGMTDDILNLLWDNHVRGVTKDAKKV